MPLTAGTRLGAYEILSPLGAGGMGEVYRARDPKLGRDVAIKVLPEALAQDAERLARFEREARSLASLNHPNIVTIYAVEEAGGSRFLAMELVEGDTLDTLLAPGGLPVARFFEIAVPLAEALSAAHERGIVHRDLKPGNVMVTARGTRQGAGLRARQARERGLKPQRHEHADGEPRGADQRGPGLRHGRVHVSGAGARSPGRRAVGRLLPRRPALPDGDRQAAVPGRERGGHDLLDPARHAAVHRGAARGPAAPTREGPPPLPREGAAGPLPDLARRVQRAARAPGGGVRALAPGRHGSPAGEVPARVESR